MRLTDDDTLIEAITTLERNDPKLTQIEVEIRLDYFKLQMLIRALEKNTALKSIIIPSYYYVDPDCSDRFFKFLKNNHSITELKVGSLGVHGVDELNKTLQVNKSLTKLGLSLCDSVFTEHKLVERASNNLLEIIKNSTLEEFYIHNNIEVEFLQKVEIALETNQSLTKLLFLNAVLPDYIKNLLDRNKEFKAAAKAVSESVPKLYCNRVDMLKYTIAKHKATVAASDAVDSPFYKRLRV